MYVEGAPNTQCLVFGDRSVSVVRLSFNNCNEDMLANRMNLS